MLLPVERPARPSHGEATWGRQPVQRHPVRRRRGVGDRQDREVHPSRPVEGKPVAADAHEHRRAPARGEDRFREATPFVQRQIDKDVASLAQGRVNGLEWHFYPSSASDTLGPSRQLLDELRARGIGYVIHLP